MQTAMETEFSDNNQNEVLKSQVENLSAYERITSAFKYVDNDPTVSEEIKRERNRRFNPLQRKVLSDWFSMDCHYIEKAIPKDIIDMLSTIKSEITADVRVEAAQKYLGVDDKEWKRLYEEYLAQSFYSYM